MAAGVTLPLWRRLRDLTMAFGRVGVFGFGGGPSFIPLIEREVLAKGWLTREAFLDAFAFGNALPGPIATKLAGYVGYRVAGVAGALVALLALTVPTIVALVLLGVLLVGVPDAPVLERFLSGLRPVVITLLLLTVIGFTPAALGASTPRQRGWRVALALAAFGVAAWLRVHPALLILAGGCLGLILARRS